MSDTPKTARVFAVAVTQPVEDAHKLWAGWAEKLERELAAVTAERDALYQALCDLRADCIAEGWLLKRKKIRVIDDATAALRVADKRTQEQLMQNAQAIMDAALRRP